MNNTNGSRKLLANRRKFLKTAGATTVVALSGCANNPGEDGSSGGVTKGSKWDNGKSIHFIGPTSESTWWRAMPAGNLIEAHKRDWDFSFSFPGWDPAAMNDEILTRAQNHDALIVNPASFGAHKQAIETAKSKYNTPVAGNKDGVGKGVTHNIQSSDGKMGKLMANKALDWLKEKYGSPNGKTIVHFQGDPDVTGWNKRAKSVKSLMKNNPNVNYKQIAAGGTINSWSNAAQTYFSGNRADAVLADSDGAYSQVILNALAANNMLYHAEHEKHIFVAGIDGYPSSAMFVRKGLQDITVPQTPFCITQNISKLFYDHILNDPSIQKSGKEIPEVPIGTTTKTPEDPVDLYWGESKGKIKIEKSDYGVPVGISPPEPYALSRDNCNKHNHWANVWPAWKGRTELMDVEFNTQGKKPGYVDKLVNEFNKKLKNGDYGEKLDYLSKI